MTTQTVTLNAPVQLAPLHITEDPIRFFNRMTTSSHFSNQEREMIKSLIENYEKNTINDYLALFLGEIVYPKLNETGDEKLLEIVEEVKTLLAKGLPKGTDVECYIQTVIEKSDFEIDSIQKVDDVFHAKEKELIRLHRELSEQIALCHEFEKTKLLKVIDQAQSQDKSSKVNENALKINELKAKLERLALETRKMGHDYKKGRVSYQTILGDINGLLRNYKR